MSSNATVRSGSDAIGRDGVPGRYFVASGHGGGWLVFREGSNRAVHRLPGKTQAVATARILARSNSPSEVMVEQRNGSFSLAFNFDHTSEVRGY